MIEILLATYNGEKYIDQLLISLLKQTYQDFKVIIRDDCSCDKTYEILKDYENKFPDKFKVFRNEIPSGSAKDNFFLLMNDASADYIMFCDQDDVWKKDKIEKTLNLMKKAEDDKSVPVLIHTDLTVTNADLTTIHNSFFKYSRIKNETSFNRAVVQNCVTGCTIMINKALLNFAKDTNSDNVIMHDWWLYLTASAFGKIGFLNEQTVLYRQHKENSVGAKGLKFRKKEDLNNSINLTYRQAEHFFKLFNNPLAKEYSNLKNYSKTKRICTIFKYKFFKHSLIRKLIHLLVC